MTWLRGRGGRIEFGGDYNPEQWPRDVWREDVALMREAGVSLVTVGVFAWARLQPGPDEWSLEWLDEVMDLLHEGGIAVDLATATASPPPWLTARHPEVLPVDEHGRTVWPGARQHWRPTSPIYRGYALTLAGVLAGRYRDHPALVAWHVNNELGCHNAHDYSDDAAQAFREWLRERYLVLDALNDAWATAFWSQGYSGWDEILPPRLAGAAPNPSQTLDFWRFSSDALRDHLRAERDLLRDISPGVPMTTNFMVMANAQRMDYASWASDVDIVANDHYVFPEPLGRDELSFSANLTSGLACGDPWWLMEHSTSAVNWQPVNHAKRRGELERDSLTHLAHGADAICFFQWRQSAAFLPSSELDLRGEALAWYRALLDAGFRCDVLPAHADLSGYRVAIAPMLHVLGATDAARLADRVRGGLHLVATYFSGVADPRMHVHLGGYPGALRELLGIRIEEFAPLGPGEHVVLDAFGATGSVWTDRIDVVDERVEVLARYATGEQAGRPAITRRAVGPGSATWVSTRVDDRALPALAATLLPEDLTPELGPEAAGRVELVVRERFRFLVNRTDDEVDVVVPGTVLHGAPTDDGVRLGPREVALIET